MIPKYEGPMDDERQGRWTKKDEAKSSIEIMKSDGKSTPIMVTRIGMDDNDDVMFQHAFSDRFLNFLREKDDEGKMRELVALSLEECAKYVREGGLLESGTHFQRF